jgi:hypothetical protein
MPPASDALELQLELDSREDPIEGCVGTPAGEPIAFTGWLELMAAVHRLTGTRPDATTGPSSDGELWQAR